ncbi:MAG: endonuclease III [Alphaproteobacteria bacterium]
MPKSQSQEKTTPFRSGEDARRTKLARRVTKAEAAEIFRCLRAQNPEPRSELNWANPFTLLVAVVLSAQATDLGVNRATKGLFRIADSPETMLAIGEAGLIEHIRTIGLFRSKARHVIGLSRLLIEMHGSEVPNKRADLEALPGVGRKTANVVLNVAFGEPTMAVDTHIFRVANRTGLAPGRTPLEVEKGLLHIVPKEAMLNAHHWLILHGRYICKARSPVCAGCIIADICRYPEKTTA